MIALMLALLGSAHSSAHDMPGNGGHQAEIMRTSAGVFYESHKLPIDPVTKSTLATILVGLTVIAFLSIMPVIGRARANPEGADVALWVHRFNGYLFIIIAVIIAQFCIRILGVYGHLSEPMVALHIAAAIPVVLIPLMKVMISRRCREMYVLLPTLGITLLLLTWITTALIIIHFFRG